VSRALAFARKWRSLGRSRRPEAGVRGRRRVHGPEATHFGKHFVRGAIAESVWIAVVGDVVVRELDQSDPARVRRPRRRGM